MGMKSILRVIRNILLDAIVVHVKNNKLFEKKRVCPKTRFKRGCLSFFVADILGAEPKRFSMKQAMQILKFFLDLKSENKIEFTASQVSDRACSNG